MNKMILGIGVALAVGATLPSSASVLLGNSTNPMSGGDPAKGRKIYVQKACADCHAVMGRGGKIGPDLAQVGKGRSHHRLVAKLWDHLPLMVETFKKESMPWPTIRDHEMEDLAAYLFYLNFFDKPGDYGKGKTAFSEKRCITCHSIGGSGASIGPPLDAFAANAAPLNMVSRMWSHGPTMVRSQLAQGLDVPKFEGSEVADILAYLRGASLKPVARQAFLSPGDPGTGRGVFESKQCTLCHQVAGLGDSVGEGPDLAMVSSRHSVSEYAGILWNHGPMIWDAMLEQGIAIPPFGPDEMSHLLAYLYFIEYYPEDGNAKKGERLFTERNCDVCHPEPGREARPDDGPPMLELGSVAEPNEFAAALWNHGPTMIKRVKQASLRWPGFTEEEMRDLTFFLRKAHDEQPPPSDSE